MRTVESWKWYEPTRTNGDLSDSGERHETLPTEMLLLRGLARQGNCENPRCAQSLSNQSRSSCAISQARETPPTSHKAPTVPMLIETISKPNSRLRVGHHLPLCDTGGCLAALVSLCEVRERMGLVEPLLGWGEAARD